MVLPPTRDAMYRVSNVENDSRQWLSYDHLLTSISYGGLSCLAGTSHQSAPSYYIATTCYV